MKDSETRYHLRYRNKPIPKIQKYKIKKIILDYRKRELNWSKSNNKSLQLHKESLQLI